MSSLPSGTVTFLFTDIEGSTNLWQKYPQAMPAALSLHHALVRGAIESHNGRVFQRFPNHFQHQPLLWVHQIRFARRDAEELAVKPVNSVQEPAMLAVDFSRHRRVCIEVRIRIPSIRRYGGNRVGPVAKHSPERR